MALALGGRLEPRPRGARPARGLVSRILPPLLFGAALIGLWELYVVVSDVPASTLPAPGDVARALVRDRSVLISAAGTTLLEIMLGFALAIVVGVGLAVAISSSRLAERALYPWLVVSQMVPIPALAPIVVVWTGFDIRPKLIVIALVSFFPIAVNTIDGLRATDPELLGLLRTLGAGPRQIFRVAKLPTALPYLFSGLRVGAAFAVIGAVFAEWTGSTGGLGILILSYGNQTATADVFAVVVVLAAIGVAMFAVVGLAERLLVPWWAREVTACGWTPAGSGGGVLPSALGCWPARCNHECTQSERREFPMESSTPARVLVVAHRTAATQSLADAVRRRAATGPARFTLLVPRTAHGLHRLADPEDTDDAEAREVIDRALPILSAAAGSPVESLIGDPTPLTAIEDAVNSDTFDEIIISTLPQRLSRWLRLDLPSKARSLRDSR